MAEDAESPESSDEEEGSQLPFPFAEDWPDDIEAKVAELFELNLDKVRGLERMGSPLAFEQAPEDIAEIRSILSELALEPWNELPPPVAAGIQGHLASLEGFVGQILELQSNSENAAGQRDALQAETGKIRDWFRNTARPHAISAKVDRRLSERPSGNETQDLDEIRSRLAEARAEIESQSKELESRRDAISTIRRDAQRSAGKELADVFDGKAQDASNDADLWLKILGGSVAVTAGVAIGIFYWLRPHEGANDPADFGALGLAVFLVGLAVFAVRICSQNYRVGRHVASIAASKAAALRTFERLIAGIESEETRAAVAHILAQAVFATEETGLVDAASDGVTLIERAVPGLTTGSR